MSSEETIYQDEAAIRWYVLHVRSRHEWRVLDQLTKAGVESFLPLVERLRRWKDRKKLVSFPLFPGYLFVHIPPADIIILNILKTYGVVRFLGLRSSEPTPIPDSQIISLQKITADKSSLDPYPYLKEGQRVHVVRGPLAGASGYLVEKRSRHLLVVAIDILKQGAAVNIHASDVEGQL